MEYSSWCPVYLQSDVHFITVFLSYTYSVSACTMASADQNESNSLKASVDKTKRYDGFNDNSKVPSETESKSNYI